MSKRSPMQYCNEKTDPLDSERGAEQIPILQVRVDLELMCDLTLPTNLLPLEIL